MVMELRFWRFCGGVGMALNAIIYDCEIIRCIPPRDGIRNDDLAYCNGWHDYEGMGISVVGALTM